MDAWMVAECLLSHSDQMTAIQCWFNTAVQQLMADLAAVETSAPLLYQSY